MAQCAWKLHLDGGLITTPEEAFCEGLAAEKRQESKSGFGFVRREMELVVSDSIRCLVLFVGFLLPRENVRKHRRVQIIFTYFPCRAQVEVLPFGRTTKRRRRLKRHVNFGTGFCREGGLWTIKGSLNGYWEE